MAEIDNKKAISEAFTEFKKQIDHEILKELELFAQNLVVKAMEFREKNPQKHDFTGNLLNSIVAAVYRNKNFEKAFFSGESGIRKPRYYEMTASHGNYHFKIDYEGKTSNYKPTIETLRTKGLDDAYEFISTYSPDINGYVLVVAYTTDYAEWVENQRATTGFLASKKYAEKYATQLFPIKK